MPALERGRRARVRALLPDGGVDAVLVTHLPDVRWLSGYSGSNGALLISGERVLLATDGRYESQARRQCPDVELITTRQLGRSLVEAARDAGFTTVGFQGQVLTVEGFLSLKRQVPGISLVDDAVPVSPLRMVKDDGELQRLRTACRISVEALAGVLPEIRVGMTEIEVARRLELAMGRLGASDRAFETIVATGANSAMPHHEPTSDTIAAGDLLKIDFGARFEGYHADCTRTFVVAADPLPWQAEIHDVVLRAQAAGREALIPGSTGAEVDAAARCVVERAGLAEQFPHGLGHGVGLEIHEAPMLAAASRNTVEESVPVTVEPGVYLPGRGGVRIEDTVVVSGAGAEVLTDFPRGLARVG